MKRVDIVVKLFCLLGDIVKFSGNFMGTIEAISEFDLFLK